MPTQRNIVLLLVLFLISIPVSSCKSGNNDSSPINLAAGYIDKYSKPNGMFDYEVDILTGNVSDRNYNILRHSGTIYALASYYMEYKNADSLKTLVNATKYLKSCCIKPVIKNNDDILGVWSLKSVNRSLANDKLKLGGTGLGLVALLCMEKIKPGTTDGDTLRKLGNFVLFLQKPEGNFYSRYNPSSVGKDDSWTSLYYPGEAALGLVMLYEYDPQPKWFNHAVKVLTYLSESRKNDKNIPADHWALLATAKIIEIADKADIKIPKDVLIRHGKQVVNGIIAGIPKYDNSDQRYGCLTRDCRTTPTSTRLEGLIAFYKVLGPEDKELKNKIEFVSRIGTEYVIRSQIKEGKFKGAIPVTYFADFDTLKQLPRKRSIVRVDYVQHALSAFLDYQNVFGK